MRPASKISQTTQKKNTLVSVTEIHMGPLVGSVCVYVQTYINLLGDVCSLILISIETSNSYGLEHVNKFWPFFFAWLSIFRTLFCFVIQNWELTIWIRHHRASNLMPIAHTVTRVCNLSHNSTVWPQTKLTSLRQSKRLNGWQMLIK